MSVSDTKSWKPDAEGAQGSIMKTVPHIPGVQDPLGSSIMTSDDT